MDKCNAYNVVVKSIVHFYVSPQDFLNHFNSPFNFLYLN